MAFNLFSPTSETKTSQSFTNATNNLPDWQKQFVQGGMGTAYDALQKAQGVPTNINDFVAQFTPEQMGVFNRMMSYGVDPSIAASSAATAGALSSAGTAGVTAGLGQLSNFAPTSSEDITRMAQANFDSPQSDALRQALLRDPWRQTYEQALPASDRAAALSGNNFSSTNDVRKAIAERALADRSADVGSQLYSSFLQNATDVARSNDASRLAAATGLVSGGTGAAGTGVNAGTASVGQAGAGFDIAGKGVTGALAGRQSALDNLLARYQFQTSSPFAGLANAWGILGQQGWGSTSSGTSQGTQTSTYNPSMMQIGSGLVGMASQFLPGANGSGGIINGLANTFGKGGALGGLFN